MIKLRAIGNLLFFCNIKQTKDHQHVKDECYVVFSHYPELAQKLVSATTHLPRIKYCVSKLLELSELKGQPREWTDGYEAAMEGILAAIRGVEFTDMADGMLQ